MKDNVFREILKPITADLIKKCASIFKTDDDYHKFKTYEHGNIDDIKRPFGNAPN